MVRIGSVDTATERPFGLGRRQTAHASAGGAEPLAALRSRRCRGGSTVERRTASSGRDPDARHGRSIGAPPASSSAGATVECGRADRIVARWGAPRRRRTAVSHLRVRWHAPFVPTTRPRYQVTESPAVARAIDRPSRRWPGEPRSWLLRRLLVVGGEALEREQGLDAEAHRATVSASSGTYADAFRPRSLAELREVGPR